jgi:putative Mg2+ transporter-C (MgtC) family protein
LGLSDQARAYAEISKVAAGVITGIGFLGAGTILKNRDFVLGLTTAASIWVVSAVGVALGLGQYLVAGTLTILVLLTLFLLHLIPVRADQYASLSLSWTGNPALLGEMEDQLSREHIRLKHLHVSSHPKTGECKAVLYLRFRGNRRMNEILSMLQEDTRFDEVSWS